MDDEFLTPVRVRPVQCRARSEISYISSMTGRLSSLTEREKEVLRLLSASHDAKSAAAHLGLSVHTINGRLRVARRKLGVSSSRAASSTFRERISQSSWAARATQLDRPAGPLPRPAVRLAHRLAAGI